MSALSEVDVYQRFAPLKAIADRGRRTEAVVAIQTLLDTDHYFFEAPAASSYGYHNPYCVDTHGLWIHTLMVSSAYERLAGTFLEQGRINEYQADSGRIAVLLHDMRKYGDEYTGQSAEKDHDLQMAGAIRRETELDDEIAQAVATHMGPWYEGPAPTTELENLVHYADMVGSSKNITPGVADPHDEIFEKFTTIPQADLSYD